MIDTYCIDTYCDRYVLKRLVEFQISLLLPVELNLFEEMKTAKQNKTHALGLLSALYCPIHVPTIAISSKIKT